MSDITRGGDARAAPEDGVRLSFSALLTYSVPTAGVGFMFYLAVLYLMKFSTDVLLIAPATVSAILGISRVIDAITDPLAGYLSDRTDSRWGRRRPWLVGSAIPAAIVFIMMWSPPALLEGLGLTLWMGVGIVGFYAVLTLINVPHQSWGAELSPDYHERTRVVGMRLLLLNLGAFSAVICLFFIDGAEDPRATVATLVITAGILMAAAVIWSAIKLKERVELQGRGPQAIFANYRDIVRNPHARLLLLVFFIESLGGATIGVLTPYMADYVIGTVAFPAVVLTYMVMQTVTVPLWTRLSRVFGKKMLWLGSMIATALGFGCFFLLGYGDSTETYVLAALLGAAAGCGNVVAPSVQSDIVDYDEYLSGERKEGGYFAGFNFVQKSAGGVTILLTGVVLELAGYQPNVAQGDEAQLAIQSLYALFPLVCYLLGALLFLRFDFNEREHDEVRLALARRRGEQTVGLVDE